MYNHLSRMQEQHLSAQRRPPMNTYSPAVRLGTANSQMARIAADPSPIESRLRNLKNFWEINAEKEREEAERAAQLHRIHRPYSFPRWRSSDAMTASLVASVNTPEVIPVDSRIPQQRLNMLMDSEKEAQEIRQVIRQDADRWKIRRRSIGPSEVHLDPVPQNPWYQPTEQNYVERSSIANSQNTRMYFENGAPQEPKRPPTSNYYNEISVNVNNQPDPRTQRILVFLMENSRTLQELGVKIPPHLLQPLPQPPPQYHSQHQQVSYQSGFEPEYPTRRDRPMSFLEREVFEAQQRDAEFLQSRQQLGMMNLQDTIHQWKIGQTWDGLSRPNSSSGFNEPNSFEEYSDSNAQQL